MSACCYIKTVVFFSVAISLSACVSQAPVESESVIDPLPEAFSEFRSELKNVEEALRQFPAYSSEAERVAGYRHLSRAIVKTIQAEILQDADFPYFRVLDFWIREGGDNPDQHYAFSPIRGGEDYRVWGQLGSAKRMELQLYAGEPWDGTGRSAGYLPFEDIEFDADGNFEIFLGLNPQQDGGLYNPEDTTTIFARHIYDEWSEEMTGHIHIDRIGHEGDRLSFSSANNLANRFRAAVSTLKKTVVGWPYFVQKRYTNNFSVNTISSLMDSYAVGGVRGRWMGGGYFNISPGKVLVIKTWPTTADYQAIQLTDLWFASMEYGNRVTSLNTTQSVLSSDGAYYFVISQQDPGHANWLDTGDLNRGTILMRYDGVQAKINADLYPTAELINLSQLSEYIPGLKRVTEAERGRVRAERRRHLQIRTGR
jgi:hypothetical protein